MHPDRDTGKDTGVITWPHDSAKSRFALLPLNAPVVKSRREVFSLLKTYSRAISVRCSKNRKRRFPMLAWPPLATPDDAEEVVCIHGLGETPLIMAPAAWMFRAAGYRVSNLTYPSTLYPIETLAERYIAPHLEAATASRIHFVTHSLGGVLLHYCLGRQKPPNLGRAVMCSPGLRGSEALEIYRHNPLFRVVYGPAANQSGTDDDAFARVLPQTVDYDLGVIAGSASLDPLANTFIPWPHDGKISAARTRLDGIGDHTILPLPHDLTSSHPLALFQIWSFIRDGRFRHPGWPNMATIRAGLQADRMAIAAPLA
jgi:hypothetical protein